MKQRTLILGLGNTILGDDGVGIAAPPATNPLGAFGLTGLYQRNQRRGLRVAVESEPGKGTKVWAEARLNWFAGRLWPLLRARMPRNLKEAP